MIGDSIYRETMEAEDAFTRETERQFGKEACFYRYMPGKFDAATKAAWKRKVKADNAMIADTHAAALTGRMRN